MRYLFVSLHLDDAVLSAGNKIMELKGKGKEVLIVTVFSEFGKKPISKQGKKYLKECGFRDLNKFRYARKKEDEEAMRKLNVIFLHLDFVDGVFRRIGV